MRLYQGSSNRCEGDPESDLNRLTSEISVNPPLQQTSVSDCPRPERDVISIAIVGTFYFITWKLFVQQNGASYSWEYHNRHYTWRISAHFHSTVKITKVSDWYYFIIGYSIVKIERVSDRYLFYYHLRDIEQQKIHLLLFYIKCMSVVWEHVVSDHGTAMALNR